MDHKPHLPSPSLVLAAAALFVAFSGTAIAASPVVKRALFADNAGKLQGKTGAALVSQAVSQASQTPGPASSAASVLSQKTASGQVAAGSLGTVAVSCDAGQKIAGVGYSAVPPEALLVGSQPNGESGWTLTLINVDDSAPLNVTAYATCIK
jgi:hypothetical protein